MLKPQGREEREGWKSGDETENKERIWVRRRGQILTRRTLSQSCFCLAEYLGKPAISI